MVKFRLASFFGWGAGDLDAAHDLCREALALFEQAGDRGSALLARNELGWIRGLSGDYTAMGAQAAAVGAEGAAAGEPLAVIQGLQGQGFAAGFRGRFGEAEDATRRGNDVARAEGKIYRLTVGLGLLGVILAPKGRCQEARLAVAEAKAINPDWRDSILPEWEIVVHWFAGDMNTALACAADVAGPGAGELSKRRAYGVGFAALASCEAGDTNSAQRHIDRAERAFGTRDWQFFRRVCIHARGVLEWQQGRLAAACTTLDETARWLQDHGTLPYAAIALLDLAEASSERGDHAQTADAARRLREVAAGIDSDLYPALATVVSHCSAGASEPNVAAIRAAIDVMSRTDCRGLLARAYEMLGRSLASTGAPGAVDALSTAVAGFDAGGATWRRDRVRAVLRGLGPEGRKAAVAQLGPAALTRREREIARLAAGGLMAAEIAGRLSISERTVETHLANVYAKLGVRSKVELIRRASEFTLSP
jgi:DNA-binding NarL/FixJ family response regulator